MDCNLVSRQNDIQWTEVNAYLSYGVKNGIVFVRVACPAQSGEADTNLGTLPDAYMPVAALYQNLFYRPSNGMSASIYIPNSGQIVAVTNNTAGATIYGCISYPKK